MTELILLGGGLVLFGLLAALLWYLANRFERAGERAAAAQPEARWTVAEHSMDGRTTVVVERIDARPQFAAQVLETRDVGAVEPGDPAYGAHLADLRTLARDRARLLNEQESRR